VSETTQEASLSREIGISAVLEFATVLAETIREMDDTGGKKSAAVRNAFFAECVKCGSRVTGEELLAAEDAPESEDAGANLKQLRLGHCVHQGCTATHYRLTFHRSIGLDWRAIFERMEKTAAAKRNAPRTQSNFINWLTARWRVAVGVGLLLFILLIRQWYLGGRIPLIHEPEKFRVDPLPPGQTEPNAPGVH